MLIFISKNFYSFQGNPVILTRTSLTFNGSNQVDFHVDKSLNKLALEVQTSCCKPTIVITDAKGNLSLNSSLVIVLTVSVTGILYN